MTRLISSMPSVSSKPKTFRGARLAALTSPAKATTAESLVAMPAASVSPAIIVRIPRAIRTAEEDVAKYQLHCQG